MRRIWFEYFLMPLQFPLKLPFRPALQQCRRHKEEYRVAAQLPFEQTAGHNSAWFFDEYENPQRPSSPFSRIITNLFTSDGGNRSQIQLVTKFNNERQKLCDKCGSSLLKEENLCAICGNKTFV